MSEDSSEGLVRSADISPEAADPRQSLFAEMQRWLGKDEAITVEYDGSIRQGIERFIVADSEDGNMHVAVGVTVQSHETINPNFFEVYWVDTNTRERGQLRFLKGGITPEVSHVKLDQDDHVINIQWNEQGGINAVVAGGRPATDGEIRKVAKALAGGTVNQELTQKSLRTLSGEFKAAISTTASRPELALKPAQLPPTGK